MTTFESATNGSRRTLRVQNFHDGLPQMEIAGQSRHPHGFCFDPADAPAIAFAILEAAGHTEVMLPDDDIESAVIHLATHIRVEEAKARRAKEDAARNRRRDELAAEVEGPGFTYIDLCGGTKRAVDLIIDLEAEAAK